MRFLILSLLLFGCAQGTSTNGATGACAGSPVIGTWDADASSDVMVFSSNCSGTSSLCSSTFTWPNFTATSGTAAINVTSSGGGGSCLPVGTTNCAYAISGTQLAFDCGGGVLNYTKM